MNDDLGAALAELDNLLGDALKVDEYIDLESLKVPAKLPVWSHGPFEVPAPTPDPSMFAPAVPSGLSKVFGKSKYEKSFDQGRVA